MGKGQKWNSNKNLYMCYIRCTQHKKKWIKKYLCFFFFFFLLVYFEKWYSCKMAKQLDKTTLNIKKEEKKPCWNALCLVQLHLLSLCLSWFCFFSPYSTETTEEFILICCTFYKNEREWNGRPIRCHSTQRRRNKKKKQHSPTWIVLVAFFSFIFWKCTRTQRMRCSGYIVIQKQMYNTIQTKLIRIEK